jgi:hypothetical protein
MIRVKTNSYLNTLRQRVSDGLLKDHQIYIYDFVLADTTWLHYTIRICLHAESPGFSV